MADVRIFRNRKTTRYGTFGNLLVGDNEFHCYTLEPADLSLLIPEGEYPLELTVSGRAEKGTLWTPSAQMRLPLIVVPGREGIRIHAGNTVVQTQGCILVGMMSDGDFGLGQSRAALAALMQLAIFPAHIKIERME